ncbi:hypothetical protein N9D99_08820, partial [Gammaproteobacteria bacterium]|nr:hypothetical protein [Gammaproteobacteria bacterium]
LMTKDEKFQFMTAGEQIQKFASNLSEHIAPKLVYEAMFYTAVRIELRCTGNKELTLAHLLNVMSFAIQNAEDESSRDSAALPSASEQRTSSDMH